eukprot:3968706-Alexandrium_andersonii.AAC.1
MVRGPETDIAIMAPNIYHVPSAVWSLPGRMDVHLRHLRLMRQGPAGPEEEAVVLRQSAWWGYWVRRC